MLMRNRTGILMSYEIQRFFRREKSSKYKLALNYVRMPHWNGVVLKLMSIARLFKKNAEDIVVVTVLKVWFFALIKKFGSIDNLSFTK